MAAAATPPRPLLHAAPLAEGGARRQQRPSSPWIRRMASARGAPPEERSAGASREPRLGVRRRQLLQVAAAGPELAADTADGLTGGEGGFLLVLKISYRHLQALDPAEDRSGGASREPHQSAVCRPDLIAVWVSRGLRGKLRWPCSSAGWGLVEAAALLPSAAQIRGPSAMAEAAAVPNHGGVVTTSCRHSELKQGARAAADGGRMSARTRSIGLARTPANSFAHHADQSLELGRVPAACSPWTAPPSAAVPHHADQSPELGRVPAARSPWTLPRECVRPCRAPGPPGRPRGPLRLAPRRVPWSPAGVEPRAREVLDEFPASSRILEEPGGEEAWVASRSWRRGTEALVMLKIVRFLANHPQFHIKVMTADRKAGEQFGSVFPHLITQDLPNLVAVKDVDFSDVDAVFCCLPHGTTQEIIKGLPQHLKIVDLSAVCSTQTHNYLHVDDVNS